MAQLIELMSLSLLACLSLSMSLLTVSVVLVGLCVLCRCLIPWLVQCNSTLALLWYDVLLQMILDLLTRTTRPQVTSDYLSICTPVCLYNCLSV